MRENPGNNAGNNTEETSATNGNPWADIQLEPEETAEARADAKPSAAQEKTKPSQLEVLAQRKQQLENRMKLLQQKEKEKERKARTRRLIQVGALAEKYFNGAGIEPAQYEELFKRLVDIPDVQGVLLKKL